MFVTWLWQADGTQSILNLLLEIDMSIPQHSLHRVNLSEFIRSQNGKFVTVDFVKKDGSARTLNGRLGVHHRGGQNNVMAIHRPYLTMYDMQVHGFRTVNLSNVKAIRADGVEYVLISAETSANDASQVLRA